MRIVNVMSEVISRSGRLFLCTALVVLTSECRQPLHEAISQVRSEDPQSPLEIAWNRYFVQDLQQHYPYGIQENCRPVFARAAAGVQYQGSVLLFHGYTACPQQFFEMRDYLTTMGFNVLIPLLPGQGRSPVQTGGDTIEQRQYYYQYIPKVDQEGAREYEKFADAMNEIMMNAPGHRIVGGLSVGGALAFASVFRSPGLYGRALILAPFLSLPPDNFWRPIAPVDSSEKSRWDAFYASSKLKIDNDIRKIIMTHNADWIPKEKQELRWGEGCYRNNAAGRAGICDTNIRNIAAAVQFGESAQDTAKKQVVSAAFKKSPTQIQFVGVEYDDGSDTRATKESFQAIRARYQFKMALCFYRGVPHSFLSRSDHPDQDMAWLTHFHERARRFIIDGQFFDTDGASQELVKDPGLLQEATTAVMAPKTEQLGAESYFDLCRQ